MTLLMIFSIWFGLGLIAELIGLLYYREWNGIRNFILIITLGLVSLVAIMNDILDNEIENRLK